MRSVTDIKTLRSYLDECRQLQRTIGLVPTMGNLHAGHMALVKAASAKADVVIATIFINPMQFGANEDLNQYPRTPEEDTRQLTDAGCDLLFMPSVELMYPNGLKNQTVVSVPTLSSMLCGASRPGHFDGVATIVSKLFNLIPADHAFFGEKDYQQLQLIRKFAGDLCFPHRIEGVPTVRDSDGLALSSRNHYLSPQEREQAAYLYQQLKATAENVLAGNRSYRELEERASEALNSSLMKTDYVAIREANSLEPATDSDRQLVIMGAVYLGKTRLIDNIRIDLDA